ncbi:cobalt ABC transporter permease [Lentibacter sp. XHP0401]|uniref:cobalt ABC transporter permease n=1 Tax=Lentibacter sp. XHP0401 TaxID=2984334 RepID=UPI0021E7BC4D|nr:cobalt ABC transporter permease [Lentibacter sp. XHP0401]MCV2892056.1 cobalt ABC transporter permease [Lentibacter sp. XHP0401]
MKNLALIIMLCAAPLPALAHKVLASVFPSGEAIEGEVGFSNGDMAVGLIILVFGPDGEALGQTKTDADGFFIFKPEQPVAHTFHGDLGAGHVAEVTMPAEEIAAILGKAAPAATTAETPAEPAFGVVAIASLSDEERNAIAVLVRDEIRPLRREMAATREHQNMQSILGGIGYILGLFGLGFYLAARRNLAA